MKWAETLDNSCILRSTYDEVNDVLYLHFTPSPCHAYGDDDAYENVILRRDMQSDEVVGITLLYPKAEQAARERELRTLGYHFNLSPFFS